MLKQAYDTSSILTVVSSRDVRKWNLWGTSVTNDEKNSIINKLESAISKKKFQISPLENHIKKSKKIYFPTHPEDFFALKLLDKYMRRIYKVEQSDRSKIIRQIRCLLEDGGYFYLLRADISNFYESIDFDALLKKIKDDMMIENKGISLLDSLKIEYHVNLKGTGLPRGIGLSATLSELYMRKFDQLISTDNEVVYYCRYVDDIFILIDKDKVEKPKKYIEEKLNSLKLEINPRKIYCLELFSRDFKFEYLGYSFKKNNNVIKVGLSENKVKKIKTRIAKSFARYKKDNDFDLLLNRLRYLAFNHVVRRTENGVLMSGNSYNYKHISDSECFKIFDAFIFEKMLPKYFANCKKEQEKIKKINFHKAFTNNQITNIPSQLGLRIKDAWKYE